MSFSGPGWSPAQQPPSRTQQPAWQPRNWQAGAPATSGWGVRAVPAGALPGGWTPATPPRRSRIPRWLLALLGLAVVFVIAIAAAQALSGSQQQAGGYANEGYTPPAADLHPPDLPAPQTVGEARAFLETNTFYAQSVPAPVRCDISDIDLMTASASALETHMNELMGCLMTTWINPVTQAGFQLPRPSVTVYTEPIVTACGKLPMHNAVYCSGDQQIYYAKNLPEVIPTALRSQRFMVETVMAHEFGHALQARTGILISSHALGQMANDETTENLYSRRTEVQADCFAGQFVRSVSQSVQITSQDLDNVSDLMASVGDSSEGGTHGLPDSRRFWIDMGMASAPVQACNTFTAAQNLVR